MSGVTFATNTLAGQTGIYLNTYQKAVNSSIEKLASGKKVNSAADAPGEIGYINRFRAAIMSAKKLNDTLQDNISMLQTADYAITGAGGIADVLQTIREKAVQSQNAVLTSQDKQNLQQEIEDLIDELDSVASSTEFNAKKLLNGEMGAKLTSSNSGLAGYATDKISSSSYHFTDITGATKHLYEAANAPSGTASTAGSDFDYTKSLGTTGTFTLGTANATANGNFDMVFTSSSEFDVYNNTTGVLTASGSVGTQFTVNGVGITLGSNGEYAEGYKYNFSLTNGSNAFTSIEEGNRGATGSAALSNGTWGSDAMMNSYFDVKFSYESGSKKYAAFDPDGNRMGSWVESGEKFTAYQSSALNGSSFTFTSADAGIGDTWRVQFANYNSLSSAGGTLVVNNGSDSFSISYTGADRLSDVVSSINSSGTGVASAELDTSTGSSILKITSENYGEEGQISLYDSSGNFSGTLGLAADEDTGKDASLKYNQQTHTSSTGYFYNLADNMVFEVANDADIASGYVNASDTRYTQSTNINGPDGIEVFIRDISAQGLGLKSSEGDYKVNVTTSAGADAAVSLIDTASDTVASEASKIGSMVENLNSHTSFISSLSQSYQESLSNHEDTDFAEETANYYASMAARDVSAAMTAQANLHPQRVMQLLGLISGS
jgi:flagellin